MNRFKKNYLLNKSSDEFDPNPYKKYNSQSYPLNFQISNLDLENSINSCTLINQYIDLNNAALNYILNSQASEALSCYEKAHSIANQLNDNFKKKESECNKGIAFYHLNDIKTAMKLLQSCYDYFYKICCEENNENVNIDMKNLTLLCKAGANLCMCKITLLYNKDDCINLINDIINIISQEYYTNNQIFYLTYLSNILFNVNNLLPKNSNTILNNLDDNDEDEENEDEFNKINQSFYELFFNFIATNDIDTWINSLDKIYQKMENSNYKGEMVKILFNQILAKCLKYSDYEEQNENNNLSNGNNEALLNEEKLRLQSLIKSINQANNKKAGNINIEEEDDIDDENINNIINEYKYKLTIIREIYQIISSFEKQIYNNNKNNEIINQKYFNEEIKNNNSYNKDDISYNKLCLISLLKYTKNYFEKNIEDENIKKDLINNITKALYSIDNPQISGLNFSNINLSSIDPDLSDNLSTIFNNLQKPIFRQFFYKLQNYQINKPYKSNIQKISNIPNISNISNASNKLKSVNNSLKSNNKKNINSINNKNISNGNLNDFLEKAYLHIYNGEMIHKINFKTNGTKEHYFQIENKTDKLQYFLNRKAKEAKKEFSFDDIIKVKIGIKTRNTKKKLNMLLVTSKQKNSPYRFISFILYKEPSSPTLDLVFKDGYSAKMWFYGLYHYFNISQRPYKICSCTKYLLYRIKCKTINKLKLDIDQTKKISFANCIRRFFNK